MATDDPGCVGRSVALKAHSIWAKWAASALGRQLAASMEQDPALTSHIPLRNWVDTVVKHVSRPKSSTILISNAIYDKIDTAVRRFGFCRPDPEKKHSTHTVIFATFAMQDSLDQEMYMKES